MDEFCSAHVQGMSGRVALPRTKTVLAMAAAGFMVRDRRAPRRAGVVRMRVEAIVVDLLRSKEL